MSKTTSAPRSTDRDWYAADQRVIAAVEQLRFFPLVIESAEGCWIRTPEGRSLLDLSASWTADGLGHAHPAIVAAITRAAARGAGASVLSAAHTDAVLLGEELLDLVPTRGTDRRVYLGHAGTDANDVAVRGARHHTGRPRILAFENGYHGGLGTAMGVSGLHVAAGSPADSATVFVPYPVTDARPALELVRSQLAQGDVAAVVVEPLQSDGGVIVPPPSFLPGLRELCDRFGTLLVIDEVKVGLGRTGHFLAHQAGGVEADVVTLGKSLGGGLPMSAVVGPAGVLGEPVASALMTTIGNAVSCAAARAVLELLRDGSLTRAAADRGAQLSSLLRTWASSAAPGAERVGEVRGRGLSIGIELVDTDEQPDDELTAMAVYRAWHLGAVAYPVRGNVIEVTPPLTITEEEVEEAARILARAIAEAAGGAVSREEIAPYAGW